MLIMVYFIVYFKVYNSHVFGRLMCLKNVNVMIYLDIINAIIVKHCMVELVIEF